MSLRAAHANRKIVALLTQSPTRRIASMYYYEQAYTKLKDRLPGDPEYGRMNDDPRFLGMNSILLRFGHSPGRSRAGAFSGAPPPLFNRPRRPGSQIHS